MPIRGVDGATVGILVAVVLVRDFTDFLPMVESSDAGRMLFSLVDRRPVYLGKPPRPGSRFAIYGHHRRSDDKSDNKSDNEVLRYIPPDAEILNVGDDGVGWSASYHDPFAEDKALASTFGGDWYAATRNIKTTLLSPGEGPADVDLGWCVLVQQPVAVVAGPIHDLTRGLWRYFWIATAVISGVAALMLGLVLSRRYESRVRRWIRLPASLISSSSSRSVSRRSSAPSDDPSQAPAAFASIPLSVAMPGPIDPRRAGTLLDSRTDKANDPRRAGTLLDPKTDQPAADVGDPSD